MYDPAVVIDAAVPQRTAPPAMPGDDGHRLRLHVMPERRTDERLQLLECRVGEDRIDARYVCRDPSLLRERAGHVLFLAVLAHYEDLLHAWACQSLRRDGQPIAAERITVWPSIVDVAMPRILCPDSELVQEVLIEELCVIDSQRYLVKSRSHVNRCLTVEGKTPINVI